MNKCNNMNIQPATHWKNIRDSMTITTCNLCPHYCVLKEGDVGECKVRANIGGSMYNLAYSKVSVAAVEPIEKKPLRLFRSGEEVVSFGSMGCNLKCLYCQNHELSQNGVNGKNVEVTPKRAIEIVQEMNHDIIAFTYNEPLLNIDWLIETTSQAKKNDIATVLVSNGIFTPEVIDRIVHYIDAVNIDVKAFTEQNYREITGINGLKFVKDTLRQLYFNGVHVEISYPLYETNSSDEELTEFITWVKDNLSSEVAIHFTRLYPFHKSKHLTPMEDLERAVALAEKLGMENVFTI